MMQIVCKVDSLIVSDVSPRVHLVKGKVHTLAPAAFHRSRKLQEALSRGDIAVVRGRTPPPHTASPPPPSKPRRAPRRRQQAPPTQDLDEVMDSLRELHNLFVQVAGDMSGQSVSEDLRQQLEGLQTSLEGLNSKVARIEARLEGGVVTGAPGAPTKPADTPIFIPSEIRTRTAKDVSIAVEAKTEDNDLSEAEEALKALRTTTS